jgi:hypothetical protein
VNPSRVGWTLALAVVALLAAGMLAAAFGNPAIEALPLPRVTVSSGPPQDPADPASDLAQLLPPEAATPTAAPTGALLVGGFVLVLLVVLGLAWWYARGARAARFTRIRPVARTAAPDTAGRMRAAIDEGISELDESDADPRRAVIACWVRLENVAAEAGVARGPGDTSTDLVARVLAGQRVSADGLAALASLAEAYREARFATHTVDPATRDRARAALWQIRAELQPVRPARVVG